MRDLRRHLVSFLAVLCLFGGQQAAFVHWASHLLAAPAAGAQLGAGGQNAASGASEVCLTCAAFAALDSGLSGRAAPLAGHAGVPLLAGAADLSVAVSPVFTRLPRGPPAVLVL